MQVELRRGHVSTLDHANGSWSINKGQAFADTVYLVTGSHPRDQQLYPGLKHLSLDHALIPTKLTGVQPICFSPRHVQPHWLYKLALLCWGHHCRAAVFKTGSCAHSQPAFLHVAGLLNACAGLVSAQDTVCVVGSSHSAILVLMNLLEMESGPRVLNLYRSSLKYAEFKPDGTIILDNTGLKVCRLACL